MLNWFHERCNWQMFFFSFSWKIILIFTLSFSRYNIYLSSKQSCWVIGTKMQLTNVNSQTQVAYQPTLWAKLFHSAPHVNITFHHVGSKFNPENELYLESLGILASVPAGKMDKISYYIYAFLWEIDLAQCSMLFREKMLAFWQIMML